MHVYLQITIISPYTRWLEKLSVARTTILPTVPSIRPLENAVATGDGGGYRELDLGYRPM